MIQRMRQLEYEEMESKDDGRQRNHNTQHERRIRIGRLGGLARANNLTPEQLSDIGHRGGRPCRKSWDEIQASRNQVPKDIKIKVNKIKRKRSLKAKSGNVSYEAKILTDLVNLEYVEKTTSGDVRSSSPAKEGD